MFIYTYVCLYIVKCDHRGFFILLAAEVNNCIGALKRVSFRYILNSMQNKLTIHLLSLQSVALREGGEREALTHTERERDRERE